MDSETDPVDEILAAIARGEAVDWKRWQNTDALASVPLDVLQEMERIRHAKARSESALPASSAALETGFEIIEEVGRGSFGRVYRALDRALGREVALKVLGGELVEEHELREHFLREARLLAQLDHPNIVRVYAVDEDKKEGQIRMVLELIEGSTLEKIVAERGALAPEEAALIGIDLCRGLAALHAKGIVHGDVKPANVMRARGGRIVLLDFGVAREHAVATHGTGKPIGGTPLFFAPEHFQDDVAVAPPADLYALGVLLYWSVSKSYPHAAESFEELRERVLEGRPTPLVDRCPNVLPAFADVISKVLAVEPANRFSSAGEMEEALRRTLQNGSSQFEGRSAVSPRGFRRRATLAGLAVIVTTAGFLAWWTSAVFGESQLDFEATLYSAGDLKGPLSEGALTHEGDLLTLKVRCAEDCYLYVFNEDRDGRLYTLFPLLGFDLQNPIRGGKEHWIPGTKNGQPEYWVVDSAGGVEHFMIIASREPNESAEEMLEEIPGAGSDEAHTLYASLDGKTRARLTRGVGGTRPNPATLQRLDQIGKLSELFALEHELAAARPSDVWLSIQLRNPKPGGAAPRPNDD